MTQPASLSRAQTAAAVADDRGGEEVLILDLRDHTLVTDYFVVVTATSRVHLRALGDAIRDEMNKQHHRLLGREGDEVGKWILLDYGDVIVHLLMAESRAYYKLERMWASAPTVEFPRLQQR